MAEFVGPGNTPLLAQFQLSRAGQVRRRRGAGPPRPRPLRGATHFFVSGGPFSHRHTLPCQKDHTVKQYWPLISCKVVIVWRHRCLVKRNFHVPGRALSTMLASRRSTSAELLAQIHYPQRRAPKQSYFGSIAALSTQTALSDLVILLPCQK
jgi:hypothetical protein